MAAQTARDIDIPPLGIAPNVVGLAKFSPFQNQAERLGMVFDMEPVTHVLTLAVDR